MPRLRDLTPEEWQKIMRPSCKTAFAAFILAISLAGSASAGPITVTLAQKAKAHRNSGVITLRDPFEDTVLGEYRFVTGGSGRGSAPFGTYEIGTYRDDPGTSFTKDTREFRRRWMIRQVGLGDGEATDRGGKRVLLELHSLHGSGVTAGCIGVAGGTKVWNEFVANMEYLRETVGTLGFELAANPDGDDAVPAIFGKRHKPVKIAKLKHKHKPVRVAQHKRKHSRA